MRKGEKVTENGKKISSELENRLDDLFSDPNGNDDVPAPAASPRPDADMTDMIDLNESDVSSVEDKPPHTISGDSPLLDLNATILSLDWEITDATLDRLIVEINRLKTIYQNDKLPFMFLQLLGSIGKYISVKKVKAHPDSIKMLHSVYAGLEKILNTEITELEKKKILSNEVRQFKSLKQRIGRTEPAPGSVVRIPDIPSPVLPVSSSTMAASPEIIPPAAPAGELVNMETILTEIRKVLRDEFSAFKTELRAMLGEE